MSNGQSLPEQVIAVLLGASVYRYAPRLAHGPAFYNSSQLFGQYLIETMGVPEQNVLWLFDETRSAGDQLRDVSEFLERRCAESKKAGQPILDLIVHYVGHGLFSGGDNDFCLAVRSTAEQNEGFTSIRMKDLAGVVRGSAAFIRKYLIFDCCFSGSAYAQFQSGPLSVVQVKVRDVLGDQSPQRGTSLLCSASAKDPSVAPKGLPRTMFSDSLLTVLTDGHDALGPMMSFVEVGELVRARIKEIYQDQGVRPEVHSPDQTSGDIAQLPFFPNLGFGRKHSNTASPQFDSAKAAALPSNFDRSSITRPISIPRKAPVVEEVFGRPPVSVAGKDADSGSSGPPLRLFRRWYLLAGFSVLAIILIASGINGVRTRLANATQHNEPTSPSLSSPVGGSSQQSTSSAASPTISSTKEPDLKPVIRLPETSPEGRSHTDVDTKGTLKEARDPSLAKTLTADDPCPGSILVKLGDHRTVPSIAGLLHSAGYNWHPKRGTFSVQENTVVVRPGPDSCFSENSVGRIIISDGLVTYIDDGHGLAFKSYSLDAKQE